jgi:hypothetical protein
MHITLIYLISFASTVGVLLAWKVSHFIDTDTRRSLSTYFRRKVLYTLVYRRRGASDDVSVMSFLKISLFAVANVIACTFGLADRTELARRCGTLFLINVIPLFLGGRSSFFADQILRIHPSEQSLGHRWIGRICVAEGLIHGVVNATSISLTIVQILVGIIRSLVPPDSNGQ